MSALKGQAALVVMEDARVGKCYTATRLRIRPPQGAPMSFAKSKASMLMPDQMKIECCTWQ